MSHHIAEGSDKSCCSCAAKGLGCVGLLLVLWGLGYALNSIINGCHLWGVYSGFIVFKFVAKKMGLALVMMLLGLAGIHVGHTCAPDACSPKKSAEEA